MEFNVFEQFTTGDAGLVREDPPESLPSPVTTTTTNASTVTAPLNSSGDQSTIHVPNPCPLPLAPSIPSPPLSRRSPLLAPPNPIRPSEKALGKRPEQYPPSPRPPFPKIRLNPTKSAALALLSSSSSSSTGSFPISTASPKLALFDAPPPEPSTSASNSSLLQPPRQVEDTLIPPYSTNAADPAFFAPNGRSLRARGVRPSYLEIPPSALPFLSSSSSSNEVEPPTTTANNGNLKKKSFDGGEVEGAETAVELLRVSGKLVKRFKKWAKDRKHANGRNTATGNESSELSEPDESGDGAEPDAGGGIKAVVVVKENETNGKKRSRRRRRKASDSSLSSLSSSSETNGVSQTRKKKRKIASTTDRNGRDSSPLSSLGSRSSSPSASPSPEPSLLLPFPSKPPTHPLNRRVKTKPKPPPTPPDLEVLVRHQSELNQFSWAEGLREVTLGGQLVEPTNEEDLPVDEGGENGPSEKKRPGWEWETTVTTTTAIDDKVLDLARSVSPSLGLGLGLGVAPPPAHAGASLAHPPTGTSSFLSVPTLLPPHPSTITTSLSTARGTPAAAAAAAFLGVPRPKTYRQIARLDWSDFHQRNKCRFTTSGSIEGVNPESLNWESWYGIEDEPPVVATRRLNQVDPTIPLNTKGQYTDGGRKGLVALNDKALFDLGGRPRDGREDFKWVDAEVPFEGGMEWWNQWRFKTLEEGMGRSWESRCRWAVRNPERKYLSDSSEDEAEVAAKREALKEIKAQRKRERKKAKREKARKEREGSGGDSELTPLEGEELSSDSDETEEEEALLASIDAATIAKHSALLMQQAADAHAAALAAKKKPKTGIMVQCPIPNCPQKYYRHKASSSGPTHERHYHTPTITIKYKSTGISAWVHRNAEGEFVCPAPECGFTTKSRGTFAVHGKPGKGDCRGPPESIPKPKGYKKPKPLPSLAPIPLVSTGSTSALDSAQVDDDSDADAMDEDED